MTSQGTSQGTDSQGPITCDEFHRIAGLVLKRSEGEHTFLTMSDHNGGTTRFANNQIVQNVSARRVSLAVTVAFGQQHGTATATDFGDEAIRDMVARAAQIARVSPVDPEYMPPLPPQEYRPLDTLRRDTAGAGPARRIALAEETVERCQARQLTSAGIVSSSLTAVGLAGSSGLLAYEPRTEAKFSVTVMREGASGWAANAHRSIDLLDVPGRTRLAIEKAERSVTPIEIDPGRYTVVLEPAAVACLIGPIIWEMDAKSYYKKTSPYLGRLGRQVIDRRLTLRNQPQHPGLIGNGFNQEGLPADDGVCIEAGVLKELRYDRFTAQEHHVYPSPSFDAPYLSGGGEGEPVAQDLDELIRTTDRGILVTNFWYIRSVNPTDLTLTGMTRDGTFLIEDGLISAPLVNFRWHESPLRALSNVESFTAPSDAVSNENWKMQLPAMKLRDFNFSSVTRF